MIYPALNVNRYFYLPIAPPEDDPYFMDSDNGGGMYDTKYFPQAKTFWHQGEWRDWQQCQVHAMAHVVHYGSSCFEGIRAYSTENGAAIFRLGDHIRRFMHSASVLDMKVPYDEAEITAVCREVLQKNKLRSAYIRPNLFYGYGNLGLIPYASEVQLSVGAWNWGAYLGEDGVRNGIKTLILPWPRLHHSQIDNQAKLGGLYVQSNVGGSYARKQGYHEGIFLNLEGHIAEGPGENIIIVKDGCVKTNDNLSSVLEGITRQTTLQLAAEMGHQTEIGIITKAELFGADEVFFTGTAAEITPIIAVSDGSNPDQPVQEYVIGDGRPGPLTLALAGRYADVVHGRVKTNEEWLTHVRVEE
jgi:branched-chain amino acid aminotransferase